MNVAYCAETTIADFSGAARRLTSRMIALLCLTSAPFVAQNSKNQNLVFEILPSISDHLDSSPHFAFLLAEIFQGNIDLCHRVPEGLVEKCFELTRDQRSQGKFVPWYLRFFCSIISVGRVAVRENQRKVIEAIQRYSSQDTVHLLLGSSGRKRVRALAANFKSDDPVLPLEQSRINDPNMMCIDLMIYEEPKLFALGMEILFGNCSQMDDLLEALKKTELLTRSQSDLSYSIKRDVNELGNLIYAFEAWGVDDAFSVMDIEKYSQMEAICKRLRVFCNEGSEKHSATALEAQKNMLGIPFAILC